MVDAVRDVAEGEGDLTRRVDVTTRDEIGEAAAWMNRFIEKVHDIIAHARTVAAGSAGFMMPFTSVALTRARPRCPPSSCSTALLPAG